MTCGSMLSEFSLVCYVFMPLPVVIMHLVITLFVLYRIISHQKSPLKVVMVIDIQYKIA